MTQVENFIYEHEDIQREIMLYFHELLIGLNLNAKLKYKIPFYYGRSWICYLNPKKNNYVELAFVRGNELSNEQGLLSNKGRKQVYSIEFEEIAKIPIELINEIIYEALLLDETKPYESKNKK